ncbi:universal stress protein UspA [Kocuria sp. CNJ-770]|uniref:universal stress protein n=1 Tax=Kocuria sp. CNJ-770 TaxID=1904964 RepID=UPI00095C2BB5|nr:universal stress protein [Kocuria sp. CNJ-770]OLT06857.1 universal stress protein UspA [Kocuria sp. CNJ-770]
MEQGTAAVVVGVDGSEQSVEALRWAARIAPALGASVRVVGAWDYPPEYAGYVPLGSDNFDEITHKRVDKAIQQAFGEDVPEGLTTTVEFGHPSKVLVRESEDAAMLVVGRRGHGGFRGLLLGSVSAACVSHASCPVLVIHEDGAATTS